MLTLWGLISPLVDRLRPAKPVEKPVVVRKRPPRTKVHKPDVAKEVSALFAPPQTPAPAAPSGSRVPSQWV